MTTNEIGQTLGPESPDPRELFARSLQAQPGFTALQKRFQDKYKALLHVLDEIEELEVAYFKFSLAVYRGSFELELSEVDRNMVAEQAKADFALMLLDLFEIFNVVGDDAKGSLLALRAAIQSANDDYDQVVLGSDSD